MKNIPPPFKFSFKAEGGTNNVNRKCNPLRRSCVSSVRNAGESAICPVPAQPFAEIVRAECAKCRRECDLSHVRATLRRSRVSSARNAGESAVCPVPAQPFAEIVRVAKCRRECDLSGARATLCGDRACRGREVQARVHFGDLPLHFWTFWRLAASLLEEVLYEALVLETCRFTFGGSLARNARFGDLALHFWRESRTKRSFW